MYPKSITIRYDEKADKTTIDLNCDNFEEEQRLRDVARNFINSDIKSKIQKNNKHVKVDK